MRRSMLCFMIFGSACLVTGAKGQESFSHKIDLYVETGYAIPSRESFRANYDRTFFIGSSKTIPLSFGLGGQYYFRNESAVFIELKRFGNRLSTSDKVSLTIMPLGVGYRFSFLENTDYRASVSLGADFCWVTTSVTYGITHIIRDTSSAIAVFQEDMKDDKSYFGIGMNLGLSAEWLLSEESSIGITTNFTLNKITSGENVGLGNLGGLYVGLRFAHTVIKW